MIRLDRCRPLARSCRSEPLVRHLLVACLVWAGNDASVTSFVRTASSESDKQTVFKGRIDTVRTHVTVVDNRSGRAVAGLTEGDFTISENGSRQTISAFVAEAKAGPNPSSPRPRRVFLIVFGNGRLQGPVDPYDGVLRFLRERLQPDDLVSVMAYNRASRFTTEHARPARVVEQLRDGSSAILLKRREDANRPPFQREDVSPHCRK